MEKELTSKYAKKLFIGLFILHTLIGIIYSKSYTSTYSFWFVYCSMWSLILGIYIGEYNIKNKMIER